MRNQFLKNTMIFACIGTLSACSGFFDKDNTPPPRSLSSFHAEIKPNQIWKTSTGNGAGNQYLKLMPAMNETAIFTAGTNGAVASTAKSNGRSNWRINTGRTLLTGPGVGDGIVVVGSMHGSIIALNETNGAIKWTSNINGEPIANPAVSGGRVIIKSLDGTVTALSAANGSKLWSFKQSEPDLILRGASTPNIHDGHVLVGFANGSMVNASLSGGQINWVQQIATPQGAFAIERMIDIDADPVIHGQRLFAATYQGNIASLDWRSGHELWSHQLSSYTGMTADDEAVFVSDAKGYIWSFGIDSGKINWRQNNLENRHVSGPVNAGNYVVVGDAQGYLHWLNKQNGEFAAREHLGSAIFAKPLTDGRNIYVLTSNGTLAAYQSGS